MAERTPIWRLALSRVYPSRMVTMDEYIEQLLAEMPESTLHDVVKNILDEPIPEAVKGHLLKPLQPRKYRPSPPPRKAKERKRKVIEKEFDPIPRHKVLRSVKDYQDELLGLFEENNELTFRQTPWALGNFLRGWQLDVPLGHPQGADPRAFLESTESQIRRKLEEELRTLGGGLKFQLALKVDLVKILWAMSQPLPTGGFRWVEDCDGLAGTIKDQPADGPEGFILEVDLEYPRELHDKHNADPLAPERIVVQKEWMSEYQHGLLGAGVASAEVEKLVPNLHDKNHYVLHYRNLQLYLSLGMKLKKVHRALRFEQSPWMEPYIRMNTGLRKQATSAFEKDLYKLMNNSVFSKTMENLRRRVNVKLVRSHEEDNLRRLIASPSFARVNIFDDDLAAVEVHKSRLVLNRPVYVGMSILDLSKTLMYDFYYGQLKNQYGDRCQLLYTDTDSLLLEIQTEDVYRDMIAHAGLYDTSNYPREHPLHSVENKKVLGKMTDECAGRPIAEYIGLRPKMYSILEANGNNTKKAKGVKKYVVKKHIRHKQYREALFEKTTFHHGMNVLRSERHHIYGQRLHKVSLSPFDSKRWIAENGVDTLAYGHRDALPTGTAEMNAYIDELLNV